MKIERWHLGVALLLVIPTALLAGHLLTPGPTAPEPTAFGAGAANLSEWAAGAAAAYDLRSAVSGTFVAAGTPEPARTLLLIHSPTRAPTADEARALRAHLESGGSLWIMDANGAFNPWLKNHGLLIGPHRLVDGQTGDPPATAGLVAGDAPSPMQPVLARAAATLVVNEPGLWEVWLYAPTNVHLDFAGNGTVDRIDPPGPHTVGVARTVDGGGVMFVMSDASVLSSSVFQREGAANEEFAKWVLRRALPEGGIVVIDESHHGWTAVERLPAAAIVTAEAIHSLRSIPSVVAAVVATVAAAAGILLTRPLVPYLPHEKTDPATAPDVGSVPELSQHVAWEIAAARVRQPVDRLRAMGATAIASALPEAETRLRRVLLNEATPEESAEIFRAFLTESGMILRE